jgi:hypothetical protein
MLGKITDVSVAKTPAGKEYYKFRFTYSIQCRENKYRDCWKNAVMFSYRGDPRANAVEDGNYVLIYAVPEGYTTEKNGREYVNEKLRIINVMKIASRIPYMEKADEYKGSSIDPNSTIDQNGEVPF